MPTVSVSPKFQVVIPKDIRNNLGIIAGQKMQVLVYNKRIEMIPIKPLSSLKGFLSDVSAHSQQDLHKNGQGNNGQGNGGVI